MHQSDATLNLHNVKIFEIKKTLTICTETYLTVLRVVLQENEHHPKALVRICRLRYNVNVLIKLFY